MCSDCSRGNRAVALLLAFALAGCSGEKRADVSGRVTYNGTPLNKPDGEIVFVGPGGAQTVAAIHPDGTYLAVGVPTGPNRVVVYYRNPDAKKGKPFPTKPKPGDPPPPVRSIPPPQPFLTPYKYAVAETSDLAVQVEPGTVYDVEMTGPKIP